MLQRKDVSAANTLLVDDTETGRRAVMVSKGRVFFWDALFPRALVEKAAGQKLDWSPVSRNRYASPSFGSVQ